MGLLTAAMGPLRWGALALLLPLVGGCYPDADEIREKGKVTPGMGGAGGGGRGGGGGGGGGGSSEAGGSPVDAGVDAGLDAAGGGVPDAAAERPAPDAAMDPRPGEPMPPDGPPPAERACADWARNYCGRMEACDPSLLQIAFGGRAACETRYKLHCDLLDLPGSTWPSKACADAYLSILCSNFNANVIPPACAAPGQRADKQPCAEETQCAGRRCAFQPGRSCGECATRSQLDEFCVNDDSCERAYVCFKSRCASPGNVGAPCGPDQPPCQALLTCVAGRCAAPGGDGAACEKPEDCNQSAGVGCNLGLRKCVKYTVADSCRRNADGTFEVCRASGFCNTLNGTCIPAAADGAPCADDRGPTCTFPARCMAGKCQVPNFRGFCQ